MESTFEQWKKVNIERIEGDFSDWIKDFQIKEDVLQFEADLTFTEEFLPVTLQVPKTFPSGVYKYTVLNLSKNLKVETFEEAIEEVIKACEEKREAVANGLVTPSPETETPLGHEKVPWEEDDFKEIQNRIAHDIGKVAQNKFDGWFAQAGAVGTSSCWIYLFIDPKRLNISDLVADAWGINPKKLITISLKFSGNYTDSTQVPEVSCFQSGTSGISKLDGTELNDKTKWGLYWTVENRIKEEFFLKYWPLKDKFDPKKHEDKSYIQVLLELTETVIAKCAENCLICGKKLAYAGVKPVVCENQACIFSYEQFGLGVDIESEIMKHPDIVDLMITFGYCACFGTKQDFSPFEPYPSGIEIKLVDKDTGKTTTYDFKKSNETDVSKLKAVLEKFPTVQELQKWVERGILKEQLFKIHPLAYPLLRWLVASNRCHLKKLTKEEQIKEMNTEHQYLLMSGTPEKEKKFQSLKTQKGTYLGFHGSAACNWHSIMRVGLKNMSGSKGQVNGAAYGSGVYLANDASTSFSYLKYADMWQKSMFSEKSNKLGVMALCEIIKDTTVKTTPYYVVPDDGLIATRYFFIYPGSGSSSAQGKNLKLPPVKF